MKRIIVESKNDKAFFEGLLKHIAPSSDIDFVNVFDGLEYEKEDGTLVRGLSQSSLQKALGRAKVMIENKRSAIQIGILIDADKTNIGQPGMRGGIENRLQSVNEAVKAVFGVSPNFTEMCCAKSDFKTITVETNIFATINIEIACHFVNVNGEGELETLLRAIAHKDKAFAANCLDAWRKCYTEKLPEIAENFKIKNIENFDAKELGKIWHEFYKTYDALLEQELDHWKTTFYHKFDTVEHGNRGKCDQNTSYEMIFTGRMNGEQRGAARYAEMYDFNSPLPEFQALCNFLKAFL